MSFYDALLYSKLNNGGSGGNKVTGVKGDAEESYRTGDVNITPANIGAYTKEQVDNLLDSCYHAAGSKACAELIASLLIADNLGNVYNVTDIGTTTADFVEGAGKTIDLGSDVVIVNVGTNENPTYKFNVLSGFVDLSNYVEKEAGKGLFSGSYDDLTDKPTLGTAAAKDSTESITDESTDLAESGAVYTELESGKTVNDDVITINDAAPMSASECVVDIVAVQSGSGDPSPSNVRPISGFSEVVITQKDNTDNPTITNTYTIQLGETVYGGTLDVSKGELNNNGNLISVTSDNTDGEYMISDTICRIRVPNIALYKSGGYAICSHLLYFADWNGNYPHFYIAGMEIFIFVPATSIQDAKDYINNQYSSGNPIKVCYELETPYTIQLTPRQIKLLENNNTIYANSGDISLEYQPNNMVGKALAGVDDRVDNDLSVRPALKSKVINGITSANGNVDIPNSENWLILCCYVKVMATNGSRMGIPYKNTTVAAVGELCGIHVVDNDDSNTVVATTEVTITIYYYEL